MAIQTRLSLTATPGRPYATFISKAPAPVYAIRELTAHNTVYHFLSRSIGYSFIARNEAYHFLVKTWE